MSTSSDRISLRVNIASGLIEIDAPVANFSEVAEHAKVLLGIAKSELPLVRERAFEAKRTGVEDTPLHSSASSAEGAAVTAERRAKAGRSSGGSSGRPGRIGSFEPVELSLTESQERSLRDYFKAKAPEEQLHQVAVAIAKGEEILGRKGLEYNEIYTLMKLGGVKTLPQAIDVVIGKMVSDNWATKDGKKYSMKFVGREYIEENLPAGKS
jgi:hypothetical protein